MANETRLHQNFVGGTLTEDLPDAATVVTDAVTTITDATVTSATAAFTAADVGAPLSGAGIPVGAYVLSVTNATTIEMSANATASASGVSLTIGRHQVFHSAELADLSTVDSSHHQMVSLDPEGVDGDPEIVMVTKHDAAATWAQITRAQRSTAARDHLTDTDWDHAAVDDDYGDSAASAGAVIGSVSLTDTRPNSTSLIQWGSEEGVIAEGDLPDTDFVALVWLRGRARKIGTTTQHRRYQYGLQYNLGAGWVDFSPSTIIGTDSSNLNTSRTPTPDHGFVSLTSTGSGIQFRAVCSDTDVANDFNFENGRLSYLVAAA